MGKMKIFAHVNAHGDFAKVLTNLGLEFTQKGQQIRMHCPFHKDSNPSLSITLEETDKAQANTFYCFGCAAKGSVIDFVAQMSGDDLRTAAARVAEISGCSLAPARGQNHNRAKPARSRKNAPQGRLRKNRRILHRTA